MFGKKGKKSLTPERAAESIAEHINDGLAASVDEVIEQHPQLAIGKELFEQGSKKPKSRGSGPLAPVPPVW